ncbi:DASH complex, subunit Dad3, partial [Sistotremastrum suecicum HHB10207 ss-3]
MSVFERNPYEDQHGLSTIESEVLWEYAKLLEHVKELSSRVKEMSEEPEQALVSQLRGLERKMGLVLTLFRASVWAVINDQQGLESGSEGG